MNKGSFCNLKIDDMKGSFLCKSIGDIGFGEMRCIGFECDDKEGCNKRCKYNMMFSCNNIELQLKTLDELIEKLGVLRGQLVIEFGKNMYEQVNGNS
jgi:hypothetical protein